MRNKYYKILLDLEDSGDVIYDISHRGGNYGVSASKLGDIIPKLGGWADNLPKNVGAYCNYLGGGLRGSICMSDFDSRIPKTLANEIVKFTKACKQRYLDIENGTGLNDETYPDGDTNWDAIGSNRSRDAGIKSAY